MADYIDRDALLAYIKDVPIWWADEGGVYPGSHKYPDGMYDPEDVINSIENAPAADVAPVRHGHWYRPKLAPTYRIEAPYYMCSLCSDKEDNKSTYCPECGAKMDEVTSEP